MSIDQGSTWREARVLIADGETSAGGALEAALRQKHVEVDLAADAAEVVALLSRSSYSVAVIDLALLEAGEVVTRLLSLSRDERPIVLATTTGGPRVELDADVVQVVIRKPFRPSELAEMIRACIDNESVRRGTSVESRRPRLDLHRD